MREFSLRSLRIFEAAASSRSFSRAAEQLGMTQSGVSQQIRHLESELGVALFDTRQRPVELTDAGRELLQHARAIVTQVSVATHAMAEVTQEGGAPLRLGSVHGGNYIAPPLIAELRRRMPTVRVRLSVAPPAELQRMLVQREVDLGISPFPPAEVELQAEAFARNPLCLVARPDHPLAGVREVTWPQLAGETFIFREAGSVSRHLLEHLLRSHGLAVSLDLVLWGHEAVKQAVMEGLGVTLIVAHAVQVELRAGQLVILDVAGLPVSQDWCLLYRAEAELTPLQRTFRDLVLAEGERLTACRTR
ncbi:MAG TPA: LysR family transcriptional regulator [Ramlibacter sp.]|nr:LysR family transcriptional regulator [Ramlibacter sp.]